jgi:hypothetical protein
MDWLFNPIHGFKEKEAQGSTGQQGEARLRMEDAIQKADSLPANITFTKSQNIGALSSIESM